MIEFKEFSPANLCHYINSEGPGGSMQGGVGGNSTNGGSSGGTSSSNSSSTTRTVSDNGLFSISRLKTTEAITPSSMTLTGDALHQLISSGPSSGSGDPGLSNPASTGPAATLGKSTGSADNSNLGSQTDQNQITSQPIASVPQQAFTPVPIIGMTANNPLDGTMDYNALLEALVNGHKAAQNVDPNSNDLGAAFTDTPLVNATVREGMGAVMMLAALGAVAYMVYRKWGH